MKNKIEKDDKKMKTLLLISISPSVDYDFSYALDNDGELTEEFKNNLVSAYGFKKETIQHKNLYLSEKTDGQELCAEIISDDTESFDNLINIVKGIDIQWREELDIFLNLIFLNIEDADNFPDGKWLTREDILAYVEK